MPAIFAIVLAAVFMADSLLADAPAQGRNETRAIEFSNMEILPSVEQRVHSPRPSASSSDIIVASGKNRFIYRPIYNPDIRLHPSTGSDALFRAKWKDELDKFPHRLTSPDPLFREDRDSQFPRIPANFFNLDAHFQGDWNSQQSGQQKERDTRFQNGWDLRLPELPNRPYEQECLPYYGTDRGAQAVDSLKCARCPHLCDRSLLGNSGRFWPGKMPRLAAGGDGIPEYLRQIAEEGGMESQFQIGQMFYYGQGVARNYKEAAKWFRRAAEQGHLEAQNSYAYIFSEGKGFSQDYAKALKWFRRAAERGLAKSQSNLGVLYYYGYGVAQDYAEALKWLRRAAEQGYGTAQYQLALSYYNGEGVERDYARAAKWSWLAAEQGRVRARLFLGMMYYHGHGVLKNRALAAEWLLLAAKQGNADAMEKLAELFHAGDGVEKDIKRAARLMEAAKLMRQIHRPSENEQAVGQAKSFAGGND